MSASALQKLCKQRGVLPVGIVERGDLFKALEPLAVAAPPAAKAQTPKPPAQPKVQQQTKAPPAEAKATQVSANKRFTRADLEAMPSKELRALCVQRGVLPNGPVERGDLLQVLAPLAVPA